jgi:single-stranded DNA-binding protein
LEGRLQTRKWAGPEGEKRSTIEIVASQMQILDRVPKNGIGAKAAESAKPSEPVDESADPFNEPGNDMADQEISNWQLPSGSAHIVPRAVRVDPPDGPLE